jgi:hypothetical protein
MFSHAHLHTSAGVVQVVVKGLIELRAIRLNVSTPVRVFYHCNVVLEMYLLEWEM